MLLGSYFYPKWLKIGTAGLGSHFRESVTLPFGGAAAVVRSMVCVSVCVCVYLSAYLCLFLSAFQHFMSVSVCISMYVNACFPP